MCAFKESKVTAVYKANGVYGRLTAYLALDFTFAGLVMFIESIVSLFTEEGRAAGIGALLGTLAGSLLITALGVLLYLRAYRKCPPALKKKCILSMIVTGMGVSVKVAVFFLPFVWRLAGADTVPDYSADTYETASKTEVWRENGMMREYLKVNSTGDMYYDPEDSQWHKIQK